VISAVGQHEELRKLSCRIPSLMKER